MSAHEEVTIGNARLILGDCREVLPTLPDFDLILTDPPYGIGEASGKNKSRGLLATSKDYGNDAWDDETAPSWVIELIRAKSRRQVIFGGNYYSLPPAKCWLVWDKDNGATDFADCELAWTNLDKAVRRLRWRWQGMLQQDMANKEVREHPTQKPVPVMLWALMQSNTTGPVCDPFSGSGTTGVVCAQRGLSFTGIERERRYFDISCERIARAQAQGQLLPHDAAPSVEQAAMTLDL